MDPQSASPDKADSGNPFAGLFIKFPSSPAGKEQLAEATAGSTALESTAKIHKKLDLSEPPFNFPSTSERDRISKEEADPLRAAIA